MTAPSLKIYCPCLNPNSLPPPPNLPSSSYSYHEIHDLYFCEECDSIRCNRCVSVEVSGYYCPNCLFEVPSASVRGEKNRYVVVGVTRPILLTWFCVDAPGTVSCVRLARTL